MKAIIRTCLALAFATFGLLSHAETAEAAIVQLEKDLAKGGGAITDSVWKISKDLGKKHGTALVAPIMERAKKWKGEEGLAFVPMLALLPRKETVKILERYKAGKDESQKLAAEEFLGEFETPDVIEGVKRYNAEPRAPAIKKSR